MKESPVTTISGSFVRTTTLITGKGQMVLLRRLRAS